MEELYVQDPTGKILNWMWGAGAWSGGTALAEDPRDKQMQPLVLLYMFTREYVPTLFNRIYFQVDMHRFAGLKIHRFPWLLLYRHCKGENKIELEPDRAQCVWN